MATKRKRTKAENIKYNTRRKIKTKQQRYIKGFCNRKGTSEETAKELEIVKNVLYWIELMEYNKSLEKIAKLDSET